jgi:UDP:flavonoid glycosyltransferase YjiC (YdhE family)
VGPRHSNVDEAIGRFGCGLSLRPGQAKEMAQYIRTLIYDANIRTELSKMARQAFEQAYCDTQTLREFDRLLS